MFKSKCWISGMLIASTALVPITRAAEPVGVPGIRQDLRSRDRDIRESWEMRPRSQSSRFVIDNGNIETVLNDPPAPTMIRLERPCFVNILQTYHWNEGYGASPGTIGLRDSLGRTYGPWQASGLPGQGGVPDAYWRCFPRVELPPGEYQVVDSDPESWSWNIATVGCGMIRLEGLSHDRRHGPRGPGRPVP